MHNTVSKSTFKKRTSYGQKYDEPRRLRFGFFIARAPAHTHAHTRMGTNPPEQRNILCAFHDPALNMIMYAVSLQNRWGFREMMKDHGAAKATAHADILLLPRDTRRPPRSLSLQIKKITKRARYHCCIYNAACIYSTSSRLSVDCLPLLIWTA